MQKRSKASEEAAFNRGDVGVDGAATEEQQDVAEVERGRAREQFLRGKTYLGREFLSWLLWRSESGDPVIHFDDVPVTIVLCDRVVLRGISGDVVEMTVRGAMSPYSPLVRRALDRGLLIHQTRLRIAHGERQFQVNVDAEHFDLKSAKLPELLSAEDDDLLVERLQLAEQLSLIVQAMLEHFLRLRASQTWGAEVVPAMKAWMEEAAEDGGGRKKKVA